MGPALRFVVVLLIASVSFVNGDFKSIINNLVAKANGESAVTGIPYGALRSGNAIDEDDDRQSSVQVIDASFEDRDDEPARQRNSNRNRQGRNKRNSNGVYVYVSDGQVQKRHRYSHHHSEHHRNDDDHLQSHSHKDRRDEYWRGDGQGEQQNRYDRHRERRPRKYRYNRPSQKLSSNQASKLINALLDIANNNNRQNRYDSGESRPKYVHSRNVQNRLKQKSIGRQRPVPSSPVVKSLLRISNGVNCEAENECKNECEEEKKEDACEQKCEQKFECEKPPEKDVESCGKDECANSDENPSTRGITLEPEENTCTRC